MKKVRVMIQLDADQARAVRAQARRERSSVSALLRRWVADRVDGHARYTPEQIAKALSAVGTVRDKPDVAERHDDYLWGGRR